MNRRELIKLGMAVTARLCVPMSAMVVAGTAPATSLVYSLGPLNEWFKEAIDTDVINALSGPN